MGGSEGVEEEGGGGFAEDIARIGVGGMLRIRGNGESRVVEVCGTSCLQ